MVKLLERVTHDGEIYEPGEIIEKIDEAESKRLFDLGVAYFVGKQPFVESDSLKIDEDEKNYYSEELLSMDYNDLKEIGSELDLKFKGNISKVDLVLLMIESGKAEEALSMTEEE